MVAGLRPAKTVVAYADSLLKSLQPVQKGPLSSKVQPAPRVARKPQGRQRIKEGFVKVVSSFDPIRESAFFHASKPEWAKRRLRVLPRNSTRLDQGRHLLGLGKLALPLEQLLRSDLQWAET